MGSRKTTSWLNMEHQKRKNNFFLTSIEKELYFTLKKVHKLNNELSGSEEPFSNFVNGMLDFYKSILDKLETNFVSDHK
jgi:hypothetical protein